MELGRYSEIARQLFGMFSAPLMVAQVDLCCRRGKWVGSGL